MTMSSLEMKLGTAFVGVDPQSGALDKAKLESIAKKLRGFIMSQPSGDGISGMWVERYRFSVDYESEIISREQVQEAFKNGLEWIAQEEAETFPLWDRSIPLNVQFGEAKLPALAEIELSLGTNLYAYTASNKKRKAIEKKFAKEILVIDGVVSLQVSIDRILLTIQEEVNSSEVFQNHIQSLLEKHVTDEKSEFLPYNKGQSFFAEWTYSSVG